MRRHTVGGQETIRSPGTKESKGMGLNETSTAPKAHKDVLHRIGKAVG